MLKAGKKTIIILALLLALTTRAPALFADTALSLPQQQLQLQQQLQDIENQISQYQSDLKKIGAEKNTLARKIKQLAVEQAKLKLQIEENNLKIQDTTDRLDQTQSQIYTNNNKLALLKNELSAIIQDIYSQDQVSPMELLIRLSFSPEGFLSAYFATMDNYQNINAGLLQVLNQVETATADLQSQQQQLADQQAEQQNYAALINLQNSQLAQSISGQNTLLRQTKGQESNYQQMLKDSKQKAAEIRSRIYSLLGVSKQVTFGEALQIATWVTGQTGVRPAFLLAVLTQESNLGRNVGTCNRAGDPPSKSWKVIMKPDRDQQPFVTITKELGVNPDTTPVSCPMRDSHGNQIGWGGAMGPAQFIPSTWMAYRGQVAAITGKSANPWDIRDAFMAAGLKLKAGGAATVAGEWNAAMRYFSGSTDPRYSFYGDSVAATAAQYQSDIDSLGK